MILKTILDGGAQFTLLMGILATGLTLVSVNNRLLDRIDRLGEEAQESDRRTSRGLLAIMGLQLCIAIVLVIRIVLSAWELAYPFLDLMIVWVFLITLIGWACVFVTTHRGFVDWWTVAVLIAFGLIPLVLKIL